MSKNLPYLLGTSILLACGILLIMIPCIIFSNYWPLMSILVFALSLVFPLLCRAFEEYDEIKPGPLLAWLYLGIFIVLGYSIPFELWRGGSINPILMGLTMGGGTLILISIGLLSHVVKMGRKLGFLE